MKKLYTTLLSLLFLLVACEDEITITEQSELTPEQQELIGTAIQFEPVVADFDGTRVTKPNNHNGGFNYNDMMYIYRQFYEDGQWIYKTPPGTIYKYKEITYGDTELFEKNSWRVYEGQTFKFQDPGYNNGDLYTNGPLTEADSLTWDSGTTVRFRAWVLSRMGNNLADKSPGIPIPTSINYPDYMVCDWVTVSGPTEKIPMAMRHLGGRLGFAPLDNNQFVKIEICTDPADYRRDDNADTNDNDEKDKYPETSSEGLTAEQCAKNVLDVYERMCWPAGVDMENLSLMACTDSDDYPSASTVTYKKGDTDLTTDLIRSKDANDKYVIRHARFMSSSDSRWYLVSIPYDMNTNEPLILPPYTRFKIWLRDVNKGDKGSSEQTGDSESHYHIFSLQDVLKRDSNGNSIPDSNPFTNGLTMMPGHSFVFYVGYKYNTLQVYADDNFSWSTQDADLGNSTSVDEKTPAPVAKNYKWWSDAITTACTNVIDGGRYRPDFRIKDATELQEFINLVNGNFTKTPIYKTVEVQYSDAEKKNELPRRLVKWYTGIGENGDGTPDTLWISKDELISQGYVLYEKYHRADAYIKAYFEEEYLKEPFSFYDNELLNRWTVTLTNNIDLHDWKLNSIGNATNPFCGYFDGNGKTLTNVFIDGGQLFGYAKNGTIANLRLESTHPLSLTGTCEDERILGCSIIAPSTTASLANQTKGFCYFVGCFHQGSTTKPLVDNSGDAGFKMYGCMQAASGITGAALAKVSTTEDFIVAIPDSTPLDSVSWTDVACNYYDTELSENAYAFAVGSESLGSFHRLQYIRGVPTHIMCAKNDMLVDKKTEWKKLSDNKKRELYGVAPWKAMNYGIYMYNTMDAADDINKCKMHYENANATGYSHRYPVLVPNTGMSPTIDESMYLNVLKQFN